MQVSNAWEVNQALYLSILCLDPVCVLGKMGFEAATHSSFIFP